MSTDGAGGRFVPGGLLPRRAAAVPFPAPASAASVPAVAGAGRAPSFFGRDLGGPRPPSPAASFLGRDLGEAALRAVPPPSFDAAEMDAARQEGFERGRLAGLAEADASLLADRTRALALAAARMAEADAHVAEVADRAAGVLAATLLAALRAAMPDLVARSALGEAGALLALVLPGLSREPSVRIEAPSAIALGVAASVAAFHALQGRVEVAGSDSMEPGGLSVSRSAGAASRRPSQVWDSIMHVIAPLLGTDATGDTTDA